MRDDILEVLRGEVGVANILLHQGAALEPPGDEITADIARECANSVIKKLKSLDVQHRGAITLAVLDTVLSTKAHRAEDEAEGDPADAVVWDELIGRTREEATLSVTFVLFLTLACLLTAIGVVTDSTVTLSAPWSSGPSSVRWPRCRSPWCSADRPGPPRRAGTDRRLPHRDGHHRAGHVGGGSIGWISPDTSNTSRRSTSSSRWGPCRSSWRCSPARRECSRWCRRSRQGSSASSSPCTR